MVKSNQSPDGARDKALARAIARQAKRDANRKRWLSERMRGVAAKRWSKAAIRQAQADKPEPSGKV